MNRFIGILLFLFLGFGLSANNIKVTQPVPNFMELNYGTLLTLNFTLTWENSWRDDYNHDAAYIFIKYKLKTDPQESHLDEGWKHVWLSNTGTFTDVNRAIAYDSWFSPLSMGIENKNTGVYIFRKNKGTGNNEVNVSLKWDVSMNPELEIGDFQQQRVMIAVQALEMVYIPRGAFRIGDGVANKGFRKSYFPISREHDILSDTLVITASGGDPYQAVKRINDNVAAGSGTWNPQVPASGNIWWQVDFGEGNEKTIRYFAINADPMKSVNYYPTTYTLYGIKNIGDSPIELWSGSGVDTWSFIKDSYPGHKAIKINSPNLSQGPFRYYYFLIGKMNQGTPWVKTIAMTDKEIAPGIDHSVLIEEKTTLLDSIKGLSARDGGNWTGTLPASFPNGYEAFYVMKYELSQEQYARFLNKLTYVQQRSILGDKTEGQLDKLQEKQYIFGDPLQPTLRNGIVVLSKSDGMPVSFGNNLNPEDPVGEDGDGQDIACNYMGIYDMLAYADWAGLRPLSEMEYEKMCRPLYPAPLIRGGYAWNTQNLGKAENLQNEGKSDENIASGNANYGNAVEGPVRVGAFSGDEADRQKSGGSFWGVMELSGNLNEMYYNVNNRGLTLLEKQTATSFDHGDGSLDGDGRYNGYNGSSMQWSRNTADIALRGGSFRSRRHELQVSDRSHYTGNFDELYERGEASTFRLGHSVPPVQEITSVLTLRNQLTTSEASVKDTICSTDTEYIITGNQPAADGLCQYLWYLREGNGEWRLLEGENSRDLDYRYLNNNTTALKTFEFKRRVITPYGDSDINKSSDRTVTVIVDRAAVCHINTLIDTIYADGKAKDGFYVDSDAASTFIWKWLRNGSEEVILEHEKEQGYTNLETDFWSHYVPENNDFKSKDGRGNMYGNQKLQLVRYSKGLTTCPVVFNMELFIESTDSLKVVYSDALSLEECGKKHIKDRRDDKIYATTLIGDQCWMAENLRFGGVNVGTWARSEVYGYFYTWQEANACTNGVSNAQKRGICPEGWLIPSNADYTELVKLMKNSEAGKKLKSSRYWAYAGSQELVGTDSVRFGVIPAGYKWGGSVRSLSTQARFWTCQARYTNNGYGWWGWWGWWGDRWDGYSVTFNYNSNAVDGPRHYGENNWWASGWDMASLRCVRKYNK